MDPEAYSWFQSVDSDHSGYISVKELKQALVNSNWSTFNDETCLMMISEYQPCPVGSGSGQSHPMSDSRWVGDHSRKNHLARGYFRQKTGFKE